MSFQIGKRHYKQIRFYAFKKENEKVEVGAFHLSFLAWRDDQQNTPFVPS